MMHNYFCLGKHIFFLIKNSFNLANIIQYHLFSVKNATESLIKQADFEKWIKFLRNIFKITIAYNICRGGDITNIEEIIYSCIEYVLLVFTKLLDDLKI